MNKCYLVGAGDFCPMPTPDKNDIVIAADGGFDHLISHGVRCDVLIGDLDSLKSDMPDTEIIRHPKKKDKTDMYLALDLGLKRGYRDFEIYGATGGRLDHTLANLSILLYAKQNGAAAVLVTPHERIMLIENESISLKNAFGKTLSVFAFGGAASGVTIKSAEYEVDNVNLDVDFPLGISNSFTESEAYINVKSGALLIFSEI